MFNIVGDSIQIWDLICKKKVCSGLYFEKNFRQEKIIFCGKDIIGRFK